MRCLSTVRVRAASLVAVCTLALGGASALGTAAAFGDGASDAGVPRCIASQLRLVRVRQSAAVGRRFWEMALRNAGRATCSLRGYPGVGLLASSGRLLDVAVKRETGQTIRTVMLAPGRRAYFTFAYEDSGPCLPHFFSAYGISVYPPGSTARLLRRTARFDICSVSVGGSPAVTPVRATLEP
jgi:hypothetical protein